MRIHAGILLSAPTCAAIGPALLDSLAAWRVNGLQAPPDVRREVEEIAELGRRFQAAQQAKRQEDVRSGDSDEHLLANRCSPPSRSVSVTYSSTQVAVALGIGCRVCPAPRRAGQPPGDPHRPPVAFRRGND